jgi:hypothetical protein
LHRANSGDLTRLSSFHSEISTLADVASTSNTVPVCQENIEFIDGGARFQSGVLRTNCIDCLDRTNVAQYAYGLASLARQLYAMEFIDAPKLNPDSSIATALMDMYQAMGDALAHQYGGSAAHNTVIALLVLLERERTIFVYTLKSFFGHPLRRGLLLLLGFWLPVTRIISLSDARRKPW